MKPVTYLRQSNQQCTEVFMPDGLRIRFASYRVLKSIVCLAPIVQGARGEKIGMESRPMILVEIEEAKPTSAETCGFRPGAKKRLGSLDHLSSVLCQGDFTAVSP